VTKKAPDSGSGSALEGRIYLKGVPLTPWAQMALLRRVSILTSAVPICFSANFLISCRQREKKTDFMEEEIEGLLQRLEFQ
jgi:hypothetical protein